MPLFLRTIFYGLLFSITLCDLGAATCVSVSSGSWNSPGTWSCAKVPGCGDSIVILAGHTVSLTAVDLTGCGATPVKLGIKGTLQFVGQGKLELSCQGVIYVYNGGSVVPSPGTSGNQNAIMTCNSTWWNSGAGTYNGPGCMPPTTPGCAAALPVELMYFTAKHCNEGSVCLEWKTSSEKQYRYFLLERSGNGSEFSEVTRIMNPSAFNSGRIYRYDDKEPLPGVNYYRLSQVDVDDQTETYLPLAINSTPVRGDVAVYPNPNDGTFMLRTGPLVSYSTVNAVIYDQLGRVMTQMLISNTDQSPVLELDLAKDLPPGVYSCTFSSSNLLFATKLIIR
jgi:hypothetical protein